MLKRLTKSRLLIALVLASTYTTAYANDDAGDDNMNLFLPVVSQVPGALCRFGVNNSISGYNTTPLRVGWFINYGATHNMSTVPAGVAFMPTIRLTQTGAKSYRYSIWANWAETSEAQLKLEIAKRPGSEWIIGNEPDRYDRVVAGQDSIEPQVYAIAYHDLYNLIKAEDPTAKVVAGSIVQPTEVRIQYLDKVLAEYKTRFGKKMPVDVWATHNFILNEVSCDAFPDLAVCWGADIPPGIDADKGMVISVEQNDDFELFKQQIIRMRQWMANNGYQGVPLYVSEYGVLFGPENGWPEYDVARVNAFMDATFNYMLNTKDVNLGDPYDDHRLVQRFSWYSVRDPDFNGSLFEPSRAISPIGQHYAAYTAALPSQTDFYPVEFTAMSVSASGTNMPDVVKLKATIANSGNVAAVSAAKVRFYNGNPAGNGVPISPEQTVQLAGCGQNATVDFQWDKSNPGTYNLFVQVTPLNSMLEKDTKNNTLKTAVTIDAPGQ